MNTPLWEHWPLYGWIIVHIGRGWDKRCLILVLDRLEFKLLGEVIWYLTQVVGGMEDFKVALVWELIWFPFEQKNIGQYLE